METLLTAAVAAAAVAVWAAHRPVVRHILLETLAHPRERSVIYAIPRPGGSW